MNKILIGMIAVFALVLVALPTDAKNPNTKGPAEKVDICHYDEEMDTYHLINVSENAKLAHLAHGDYLLGDELGCWNLIETVTVPAIKSTDTFAIEPLIEGVEYKLVARGTANAGDGIEFDARYSYRTPTSLSWTDSVSNYGNYGPTLLDLLYNGSTPWGDYDPSHIYEAFVTGDGNLPAFRIYDIYYPNNTGNLHVDIYTDL